MIVYHLHVMPGEYAADETNEDEYFTSLAAAKKRRAEIKRGSPFAEDGIRSGPDLQIDKITLVDLPPLALAVAILNNKGFIAEVEPVVDAWHRPFPPRPKDL